MRRSSRADLRLHAAELVGLGEAAVGPVAEQPRALRRAVASRIAASASSSGSAPS
jgi:hypothetical protein